MREDITAKWARETAEKFLNERATNQLSRVLTLIEESVKSNLMTCTFYSDLEERVISELNERGFTVKFHASLCDDDDSYTISW